MRLKRRHQYVATSPEMRGKENEKRGCIRALKDQRKGGRRGRGCENNLPTEWRGKRGKKVRDPFPRNILSTNVS